MPLSKSNEAEPFLFSAGSDKQADRQPKPTGFAAVNVVDITAAGGANHNAPPAAPLSPSGLFKDYPPWCRGDSHKHARARQIWDQAGSASQESDSCSRCLADNEECRVASGQTCALCVAMGRKCNPREGSEPLESPKSGVKRKREIGRDSPDFRDYSSGSPASHPNATPADKHHPEGNASAAQISDSNKRPSSRVGGNGQAYPDWLSNTEGDVLAHHARGRLVWDSATDKFPIGSGCTPCVKRGRECRFAIDKVACAFCTSRCNPNYQCDLMANGGQVVRRPPDMVPPQKSTATPGSSKQKDKPRKSLNGIPTNTLKESNRIVYHKPAAQAAPPAPPPPPVQQAPAAQQTPIAQQVGPARPPPVPQHTPVAQPPQVVQQHPVARPPPTPQHDPTPLHDTIRVSTRGMASAAPAPEPVRYREPSRPPNKVHYSARAMATKALDIVDLEEVERRIPEAAGSALASVLSSVVRELRSSRTEVADLRGDVKRLENMLQQGFR